MEPTRVSLALLAFTLTIGAFGGPSRAGPHVQVAQAEVRIPSEAQIDRMERRAISTPPLDVSEGAQTGGEAAEIRQMDRRSHSIDEELLGGSGVCSGC